ncbi:MAG: hypothetical protein JXA36_05625 [Coriobacteriia bacterium]|nr:hypothetical protein [Coriobacteriia bacterium]
MRYDQETARIELSATELAGAVSGLELRLGPIAPGRLGGGGPEALRTFEDALPALPSEARDLLETGLTRLAAPKRALKVAAAAGEAWLHRAVYAWDDTGTSVLASQLDSNFLAESSAGEIVGVLTSALIGDTIPLAADVRIELDGRAALALVAAADAVRYGRLAALASHRAYPEGIVAAEVAARLAESMVDDPRWSTNLYGSVLPFDASAFMDTPTVDLAMRHLAEAGLFAATGREGALPAFYHPTDEGLLMLETIANANGRVALTLFEDHGDGELAYESMLIVSGPNMILAMDVAPEGGGVVALTTSGLTGLISRLAGE